ncbi:mycobacterial cell wall arabinan synthesis family protein [Mycobacterium kansasii]|uniref:Mycobacterial cell wall arabinan synthesis family protein n=1 Tax=Mycobacterium kansasii TaxID=1768 RepID=A0A1V3XAR6_MYCKA|nr:mycobacterial cell wall arabinan synthesis family protein [Mycobacterium kansasii]
MWGSNRVPTPNIPANRCAASAAATTFGRRSSGVHRSVRADTAGLSFSATVDTRYSSSPTPLKMAAMILGLLSTAVALVALHVLDTADGTRHRRILPQRWWSIGGLDALVIAVLVWWHFVGANTSDDGYILTMARVSEHAGYMANYYRWFGTPEAPFGWYYDLLAMWAHVSTASVWMRLPTLAMALTCWWLISREVIPRLGHAVKHSRAAAWTAAGMFLAVWLPLNNGLRPEPIIALGILLTWCSVERAVATSRLLPVAIACILGALTLFSGPTGIASIGALLVAIGPLRTILHRRYKQFGALPLLAPLLAAATVTAILIFRDQTFAGETQASLLKRAVGPSLKWFDEHIRYERLFMASPDGSVARASRCWRWSSPSPSRWQCRCAKDESRARPPAPAAASSGSPSSRSWP